MVIYYKKKKVLLAQRMLHTPSTYNDTAELQHGSGSDAIIAFMKGRKNGAIFLSCSWFFYTDSSSIIMPSRREGGHRRVEKKHDFVQNETHNRANKNVVCEAAQPSNHKKLMKCRKVKKKKNALKAQ